jgi:recombinational DNA repair ATPase RecF
MGENSEILGVYLHLARASGMRQRWHVRDRLLLIAAVFSSQLKLPRIAAYCRRRILEHNPRHLLRRWPSLEEALRQDDFQHLLRQVQRQYPLEKAERMLAELGIDMARERAAYFSDEEYAAALLGISDENLDD